MADVMDDFIRRYRKEYDYYEEVARLVEQQCGSDLEAAGIRAIVTHRAKRPDSLLRKLRQRSKDKKYPSVEDVYSDIHDLAGVRIALYFPADRHNVDKLLRQRFVLTSDPKEFPDGAVKPAYNKRFSGYWASHYRVRLNEGTVPDAQKRYADAKVEIQLASVLMHAWAEVEHDLVYKPASGRLSPDEYAVLDEINGLVLAGEIALERLQRALERRVERRGESFSNHYELAAFLYEAAKPLLESEAEPVIGRVDVLFELLRRTELATPEALQPFITTLQADTEQRPVAEQIIDQIIAADPAKYGAYSDAQRDLGLDLSSETVAVATPDDWNTAVGAFMTNWIKFERIVYELAREYDLDVRHAPTLRVVSKLDVFKPEMQMQIDRIRRVRNVLVHGVEVPDPQYLRSLAAEIDGIIRELAKSRSVKVKRAVKRALESFRREPPLFGLWHSAG
jgi:ppGpp synthetase/RelA/SpoT-type nucleotidyltranferase